MNPGIEVALERPRPRNGGLKRAQVSEIQRARLAGIQRARLVAAISEVACEDGVANVTVERVVKRARISRRTFYEVFTSCEDCFLAALDEAIALASSYVLPAHGAAGRWRERIRAALTALLQFLDEEPVAGRLLLVESVGANAQMRRSSVLVPVLAAVDEGRLEAKAGLQITPLTAEAVVGGVLAIIHARLLEGPAAPLVTLANPLMGTIVLPYLGLSTSRQELSMVVSENSAKGPASAQADLLQRVPIPIRLTYRTVQVLLFIAAKPGSNNREIGRASGIADQGQISRLLARLQRLGLIQNKQATPGMGAPNTWMLTAAGIRVERVLSADTNQRRRR